MQFLQKCVRSSFFSYFILAMIVLNAIVLGLDTIEPIQTKIRNTLNFLSNFCLFIFLVEVSLRIIVFKKDFFIGKNKGYNCFDLFVTLVSLGGLSQLSMLRAFSIFRVLRLVSVLPSMRLVVSAMLRTLPAALPIAVILFIFFYVYGVLCVNLFGKDFPQFFGTLGESFYTLFQIMTLEGWSEGIVRPVMVLYPYAWLVFTSFIFIVSFVVMNLVVGIIVESIAELKTQDKK
ncbi:ion transporter [Helicobacter jaachi]|uniref:Ion transporter n=1 Tax=Helicobacter jaachi TaxID=1677920 RepID=A0A4U8TAB3_9HELI|nr:ion transporter [Helicobacter jaachi]TLD96820.1 ion transporter [Helicobacter jaachi]